VEAKSGPPLPDWLFFVKCYIAPFVPGKYIDHEPVHYISHETCSTLDWPEGQGNPLHGHCDYEHISTLAVVPVLYEQVSNFHNDLNCMETRPSPNCAGICALRQP